LDPSLREPLKRSVGEEVLLLEASTPDEAAWVSELYEGDIDLVIFCENGNTEGAEDRARERIRASRPNASFLPLTAVDNVLERSLEFAEFVKNSLQRKTQAAITAGS
jgi:hypothetical protein